MKIYNKAEEGYKEKLEKIQLEQDHESEIIETLKSKLKLRQNELSKQKRTIKDIDIKRE